VRGVRIFTLIGCAVAPLAFAMATAQSAMTARTHYQVIARYAIGGSDTGYDYLRFDPTLRRLYVAHATRVEVLDIDAGSKVGEISGMQGVHGIEIVPALEKGYTSDGLDRAVTVFDRRTLQVLRRIQPTGIKPDAIQYDPEAGRLFVVNGGASGNVTVIDPTSDTIVGSVELGGGKLEELGFDGRGHAFVNDEQRSVVHVFDTHTLRRLASWPLAACEEPTGLAVDQVHHRVFAACGNRKLAVIDSDDGHIVVMLPIGSDPDGAVFDPATQRIFTSNREGTLSVLHELTPDRYEVLQTARTEVGARTLAFDATTGRIYLPTARSAVVPAGTGRAPILPETFSVLTVAQSKH
jgi:DNA-binding beta-propeller fold protein YncE